MVTGLKTLEYRAGLPWVKTVFFLLGDDVFSNNYGIIDDDAKDDNQGKQ